MTKQTEKDTYRFTFYYLWSIAFITTLLGLVLVLLPNIIGHLFFDNGDSSTNFFVRMLGSTLIGYGVLCFLSAKSKKVEVYKIAVWANLSTLITASIISITYKDIYTGYGWVVIGQHLIFTTGFLYCAWELNKDNYEKV